MNPMRMRRIAVEPAAREAKPGLGVFRGVLKLRSNLRYAQQWGEKSSGTDSGKVKVGATGSVGASRTRVVGPIGPTAPVTYGAYTRC